MEQANRVNASRLPDSVDPADALLEPQRIPRQLEIDDDAAAMMEIQPLAGGVRGNEHVERAVVEGIDGGSPEIGRHAAMNRADSRRARARLQTASRVSRYSVKITAGSRSRSSRRTTRRIFELHVQRCDKPINRSRARFRSRSPFRAWTAPRPTRRHPHHPHRPRGVAAATVLRPVLPEQLRRRDSVRGWRSRSLDAARRDSVVATNRTASSWRPRSRQIARVYRSSAANSLASCSVGVTDKK